MEWVTREKLLWRCIRRHISRDTIGGVILFGAGYFKKTMVEMHPNSTYSSARSPSNIRRPSQVIHLFTNPVPPTSMHLYNRPLILSRPQSHNSPHLDSNFKLFCDFPPTTITFYTKATTGITKLLASPNDKLSSPNRICRRIRGH